MKKIVLLGLLILGGQMVAFAQLNEYKYFVVPKQFKAFDNKPNRYKTSTLIKYLLVNNNMQAVYDDAQPPDLIMNPCMGLYIDLIDSKRLLTTEVALAFKDCENQEVFTTEKRKSSIKDYYKAYDEAIRKAFTQVESMAYNYSGPAETTVSTEVPQQEETSSDQEDRVVYVYVGAPTKPEGEEEETEEQGEEVTEEINTNAEEKPAKPLKADFSNDVVKLQEPKYVAVDEGRVFRVTNNLSKKIMYMSATQMDDVFILEGSEKRGVVFKKKGKWFIERIMDDGSHQVRWMDLTFQK